jgi:hypothetical protein
MQPREKDRKIKGQGGFGCVVEPYIKCQINKQEQKKKSRKSLKLKRTLILGRENKK